MDRRVAKSIKHGKSEWFVILLVLLMLPAWAATEKGTNPMITSVRVKTLKLYIEASTSSKVMNLPANELKLNIPVKQVSKGGWLQIIHQKKLYWIRKYQVKTDKTYNLSTRGGCDRIAVKAGGYGGIRGLDGGCKDGK